MVRVVSSRSSETIKIVIYMERKYIYMEYFLYEYFKLFILIIYVDTSKFKLPLYVHIFCLQIFIF